MNPYSSPSLLYYSFHPTPFGNCFIAFCCDEIYHLSFASKIEEELIFLKKRFNDTEFQIDSEMGSALAKQIFIQSKIPPLHLVGTNFQVAVWRALLQIPLGTTATYLEIANAIGKPKAVRAVASAIKANNIAYLVPCHRVIRTDGSLGGYRWGLERKRAMLDWEQRTNP